jgi:hypothetical protein
MSTQSQRAPKPRPSACSFAPGARVRVRDEEWVVRLARPTVANDFEVQVTGLSELVRGKQATFVTGLDTVEELNPEETRLVHDQSAGYRRARLYLESLLRKTPPTEPLLYIGHRAAMEPAPYQLVPAAKALAQPRPRLLIADAVGLGKTLEVGILLSELIRRGRGRRILVVTLRSMLEQFQQELWARFTIPLVRLDSNGLARVQRKIPANMNPFYYFDRVIISIDTLKRDEKYRRYLEQCHWDVTVIDECQHVAQRGATGPQRSQRARLAHLLARTCDAMVMTSATPHDGKPESFASLIQLLDPAAIADIEDYRQDEIRDLYVRRFKKDVASQTRDAFAERKLRRYAIAAGAEENAIFDYLVDATFQTIDSRGGKQGVLFRTLLVKSLLSSPEALLETINQRLSNLEKSTKSDAVEHDGLLLAELRGLAERAVAHGTTKLAKLVSLLREAGIGPKSDARVVIFSERLKTLDCLAKVLRAELKLPETAVDVFHGSLDDEKQQQLVRDFGVEKSPLRILLSSDAGSEGINLHYHCHRLVHFDVPWSLITLEQRNGRIDRFGQKHTPEIYYLLTEPAHERMRGDLRIVEILTEKEEQAHKNLGDVRWLMKLEDATQEEHRIAQAVSQHEQAEDVLPDLDNIDLSSLLAPPVGIEGTAGFEASVQVAEAPSLYPSDYVYLRDAWSELEQSNADTRAAQPTWHDDIESVVLPVTDELAHRFAYLPPELRDCGDALQLTTDRKQVQKALEQARSDASRWPAWQLLWPLHPVLEWLDDRVIAHFAMHEAPVLRVVQGLAAKETAFVMQGVLSNQDSQPVIVAWLAVRFAGNKLQEIESFAEFAKRTGLAKRLTNDGSAIDISRIETLRAPAVAAAREHMAQLRKQRADALLPRLVEQRNAIEAFRDRRHAQLQRKEQSVTASGRKLRSDEAQRLERARTAVETLVEERNRWLTRRVETDERAYVRIAAVIVGGGS